MGCLVGHLVAEFYLAEEVECEMLGCGDGDVMWVAGVRRLLCLH